MDNLPPQNVGSISTTFCDATDGQNVGAGATDNCVRDNYLAVTPHFTGYTSYTYKAQRVVVKLVVQAAIEWRTGDGESDRGMISRVTKSCFGKRYSE